MKSIEVTIAGRSFPLKVTDEEEKLVMSVAEEINQKVRDFQKTYKTRDRQDCLSMALLTYALEFKKLKDQHNALEQVEKKADSIEALLEAIQ